jgi:exodeoxyribonuclease VII large subunit
VIWKGVFSRLRFRPEEGLEVVATGRITTFPGKSTYQIVVEALEPAGIGALMALLEERRRKLQEEGLFDAARKRKLPFLPGVIGIVTSPTGAVIRDMIHRLSDRFPRQVLLWPVRVQGEGSAAEIAAGIRGLNAIAAEDPDLLRPDVIVVARGGGSLEDLWSFNEEIVVRAAAESAIPLVSAIGHETDWTLLDLVADIRAPTPSAAAEMVVPVRAELIARVRDRDGRLARGMARLQERWRRDLQNLARALPPPERALEAPRQRLDRAGLRAAGLIRAGLDRRGLALAGLARRLGAQTPEARLARAAERLDGLGRRLPALPARLMERRRERLAALAERLGRALAQRLALERRDSERRIAGLAALSARLEGALGARLARLSDRVAARGQLLESLGYRRVLARGYAVVRDEREAILASAGAARPGAAMTIEFADGRLGAVAAGEAPPRPSAARSARPRGGEGGQGSLF